MILLGNAIFDVVQETLRHQRVLVQVHQMRGLKEEIMTIIFFCVIRQMVQKISKYCQTVMSTIPFSGRRHPQCLRLLSWPRPSQPAGPLYREHTVSSHYISTIKQKMVIKL